MLLEIVALVDIALALGVSEAKLLLAELLIGKLKQSLAVSGLS